MLCSNSAALQLPDAGSPRHTYALGTPLPPVSPDLTAAAAEISQRMTEDWRAARALYVETKGLPARLITNPRSDAVAGVPVHLRELVVEAKHDTLVGISLRVENPRATVNQFRHHFDLAMQALEKECASDEERRALLSLTALLSIRNGWNQEGFLAARPLGLFRLEQTDWEVEVLPYFKHVIQEYLKIRTPQDLLDGPAVSIALKHAGLTEVLRKHSFAELLELAWPGLVDAPGALVPPWRIQKREKFIGNEATDLTEAALKAGARELGLISENGSGPELHRPLIASANWSAEFRRVGLGSIVEKLGDSRRTLWRALSLFGYAEELGPGPTQVLPHRIETLHSWRGDDGPELLDCVTIHLIEHRLRKAHPEYFADKGQGSPLPEQLKKVTNWHELFAEIAPSSLKQGGVSAETALRSAYPELFGSAPHRLRHEHFLQAGKWKDADSEKVFAKAFLYGLADAGIGSFVLHPLTRLLTLQITQESLAQWESDRPTLQTDSAWLHDFLKSQKLCGAAAELFNGTPREVIRSVLDIGALEIPRDLNTKRDRWISDCFMQRGDGVFRAPVGVVSRREADEFTGAAPKHAPSQLSAFRRDWFWVPG